MTTHWPPKFENPDSYILTNLRVPPALCAIPAADSGWCEVDLHIRNGAIVDVAPVGAINAEGTLRIDAQNSILLSGLVDCHTHLDKAHVAAFTEFSGSDLAGAIEAMALSKKSWTADGLARRVAFSLETAYSNGVRALRSHVDFSLDAPDFIWEVLENAVQEWKDRIEIQLSPLANIAEFADQTFTRSIYEVAGRNGRIGLFLYNQPGLREHLLSVFQHANARGWDIDLHVDEGLDPKLDGLNAVAQVVRETQFKGTVLCGHCVALNSYDPDRRDGVIAKAVAAGLHFVALPVTNLYLQSRGADANPQVRGMAPVALLARAGATISLGADNVNDGFCAFGDFDPMAVLNLGAQVGHLDNSARDWAALVTRNPASTLGLKWDGFIEPSAPADLVLFEARNSREMNLRSTPRRVVIRQGKWVKSQAPELRNLI